MGLFDWLGPIRSQKRAPWELGRIETPSPLTIAERRSIPLSLPNAALTINTVTYGAGAYSSGASSTGNSAVYASLRAISDAIAEPELAVYDISSGDRIEVDDSELGRLLARPNPYFSLDTLLWYLALCLHVDGNAYWRKLRAGDALTGNVVELWPISPTAISPYTAPGTSDFITEYRYTTGTGQPITLAPSNVVHFRYGLDDRDHRVGCAPLRWLFREISSDEQATAYADRLLRNLAINGLTLSFDKEAPAIDQATADELKARIHAAYSGDNLGAVSVLSPGATLTALGFSPEQLDLKAVHRVPEERISAVLGVPAIVAGLGAGLDRATYANFKEAREAFTETKLIPLWASIAGTVNLQLVPDFASPETTIVDFDTSDVRALADDANALAIRLKTLVEAGIIDTDEARAELGMEPRAGSETVPVSAIGSRNAASRRLTELRAVRAPERKSADDLLRSYSEQRAAGLPDWESDVLGFLERQLSRITRRLHAGGDTGAELVPDGEAILLGETLVPLQTAMLSEVSRAVAAELGILITIDDPATRAYLRVCGERIVGITETTRSAVQAELTAGQHAGEGIPELARRIRDLPHFGQSRAETIARTELGNSQNAAALTSYRSSGVVVGIRVHDGDYDAECSAMNGRVFPLDQAPPGLQHPRCVRAFAPLTDAAELTRSA